MELIQEHNSEQKRKIYDDQNYINGMQIRVEDVKAEMSQVRNLNQSQANLIIELNNEKQMLLK